MQRRCSLGGRTYRSSAKGRAGAGQDTAYDSDEFREFLIARGTTPVIKPNPTRAKIPPFDTDSYKGRNVIKRAFSHVKDWRRVATRYDKLVRNFRATVTLALLFRWWI